MITLRKSEDRGHFDHDWLKTNHTFSFGSYRDPEHMGFSALRVINEDIVAPSEGFDPHPHRDMEIITYIVSGALEHKDSMGNVAVIKNGDVQVMSAGSGITHSEYNRNQEKLVKFLQIWVFPNKKNVDPRYDQITLKEEDRKNKLQQILSPDPSDDGVWIHQNAWFHLGKFDNDTQTNYQLKDKANGVYAFVINGDFQVNGQLLNSRDGLGLWDISAFDIKAQSQDAEILLMEVPMVN